MNALRKKEFVPMVCLCAGLQIYQVVEGLGETTRLAILLFDPHVSLARESNLHFAWEILRWFDRYLKRPEVPQNSDVN